MPAKEILEFKKDFTKIIKLFFGLQNLYVNDEPRVTHKLQVFKKYLVEFNKKYPKIRILLEERDLTTDDLKIFLVDYKKEAELQKKFNVKKLPIMVKENKKYGAIQILLNYKRIENGINTSMDFLCQLATEEINNIKLKLPEDLRYVSLEISEGFSCSDARKAGR